MVALPAVGVTSPSSERSVVVLPEPLGPRKPVIGSALDCERQVVDGVDVAVVLGQVVDVDEWHGGLFRQGISMSRTSIGSVRWATKSGSSASASRWFAASTFHHRA